MAPSPSPTSSPRGFAAEIFCGDWVKLLEVSLTVSWVTPTRTGCPWSFKTSELPTLSPREPAVRVRIFLPQPRFPGKSLPGELCSGKSSSCTFCLSLWCRCPGHLVCSESSPFSRIQEELFSLLLRWRGNFQIFTCRTGTFTAFSKTRGGGRVIKKIKGTGSNY